MAGPIGATWRCQAAAGLCVTCAMQLLERRPGQVPWLQRQAQGDNLPFDGFIVPEVGCVWFHYDVGYVGIGFTPFFLSSLLRCNFHRNAEGSLTWQWMTHDQVVPGSPRLNVPFVAPTYPVW